jgi:Xaa-Pro dipeptidase
LYFGAVERYRLMVVTDNILVTEDGMENLTPTPKEIDEITQLVKSG